jgi:hypothetical protein
LRKLVQGTADLHEVDAVGPDEELKDRVRVRGQET